MDYPNWFQQVGADSNFGKFLTDMPDNPKFLQIGAFVGHASEWLLTHFPTAVLFDVDTWQGSDEDVHSQFDWGAVEAAYDERVAPYGDRVVKCQVTSDEFFAASAETFDFIYIDGSHTASQVMKDGFNAVDAINQNGVIAFDDYLWGMGLPIADRPHEAIDLFLLIYEGKYDLLDKDLQVWMRWN